MILIDDLGQSDSLESAVGLFGKSGIGAKMLLDVGQNDSRYSGFCPLKNIVFLLFHSENSEIITLLYHMSYIYCL